MSRKKKKRTLTSESKTCFYFAAGFLVVGILCIIFGKTLYHTDDMLNRSDKPLNIQQNPPMPL